MTDAYFSIASKNDTVLYYRHKHHTWPTGQAPPPIFQCAYPSQKRLLHEGCKRTSRRLTPPMEITSMLKERQFSVAHEAW
ncbi:hypothetical protein PanWU01x14_109580 [Parasponia andersonii]|uniref:Uncharacterized protein n=1 Tax=Parasponia andersonii TaxID=3476 RepID=A0A2P5CZR2_PARAD|nr:hypothetical protein PanWU01x14_109580 [Parasponia andersonii]